MTFAGFSFPFYLTLLIGTYACVWLHDEGVVPVLPLVIGWAWAVGIIGTLDIHLHKDDHAGGRGR